MTALSNQRLRFATTGQRVVLDCPHGRPDASPVPTVTVYDPRHDPDTAEGVIVAQTNAPLRAVDVTTNGPAGPTEADPRRVPLAAATMATIAASVHVGDCLWLEGASQQREQIQVARIGSDHVGAVDKLAHTYATGAKVQSAVLSSPAIPDAFVNDEANLGRGYYAEFAYSEDGEPHYLRRRFDVVREIGECLVTAQTLLERHPEIARKLGPGRRDCAGYLRAAERDVDALMRAIGIDPALVRSNEDRSRLVELRTLQLMAEDGITPGGRDPEAFAAERRAEYETMANLALGGKLSLPYDANEDDVANDEAPVSNTYFL
jgi:hypothetical protein